MSNPSYSYSYFRIPKDDGIIVSAQKYRTLRLNALKASPGSFASTYEIESLFTSKDWENLITTPNRETFICAATPLTPNSNTSETEPEPQWIGQVTLRGPLSLESFTLPDSACQPPQKPDSEEERWQMLSLFTLPSHRGLGLGAKLCRNALDYLVSYAAEPQSVQVRLMIKPENHVTIKLYERLGFGLAGRATLVEALTANGDEGLLPVDRSAAKWSERSGLIMNMRLLRS
jgi:ribosomal protein S18 acetylase RimI-like enzyme